jgi:hypothetical protein
MGVSGVWKSANLRLWWTVDAQEHRYRLRDCNQRRDGPGEKAFVADGQNEAEFHDPIE